MSDLQSLFLSLAEPGALAGSVYLALVPRAKNWPAQTVPIPKAFAEELLVHAPAIIFPSLFAPTDGERSTEPAIEAVRALEADREAVVWTQAHAGLQNTDSENGAPVRIEYCFAHPLLLRLRELLRGSEVEPWLPLCDLLMQIRANVDAFVTRLDELRSRWLLLRGAAPYREDALFTEATVLIQHISNLIRIVIGETEDDIDPYYQYEWLAPHVRLYHEGRLRR